MTKQQSIILSMIDSQMIIDFCKEYDTILIIILSIIFLVSLYFNYKAYHKSLEKYQVGSKLEITEKLDFMYQDIWIPTGTILALFMMYSNFLTGFGFSFLVVGASFRKLILRNKLIITDSKIAYSKAGVFSEIEFRLVKGMIFDEDERRVTINYEKIIPPKYSFLSTKVKTLDIDEVEETKNENKVLKKEGLFKKDWENLKIILENKSKEYDFGLSVVYPI